MNKHLVICIIYTIINIGKYSSGQDLYAAGTQLLNNINAEIININQLLAQEQKLFQTIPDTARVMDYGIPENPQMIEIEKTFKQLTFKKGIADCVKLKNDRINSVKATAMPILIRGVRNKLPEMQSATTALSQKLGTMAGNLKGANLDAQVKICQQRPADCIITRTYPPILAQATVSAKTMRIQTDGLVNSVFKTDLYQLVTAAITSQIYKPVTDCIKAKSN